jgi:hypothetical protein
MPKSNRVLIRVLAGPATGAGLERTPGRGMHATRSCFLPERGKRQISRAMKSTAAAILTMAALCPHAEAQGALSISSRPCSVSTA